tara:strand:- start:112 stop:237 length:126 start_codon:yes stop_codon:yes gene_type:complete
LKKNKLNSTNPKYKKKEEIKKVKRKLLTDVKGVKVYAVFYL